MRAHALRVLGTLDIASGALVLGTSTWLAGELDLGVTPVRLIGAFLLILGIEKVVLRDKPVMARISMAVEVVFALAALDVALLADPTAIGIALLVGTAAMCAAIAAWLFTLRRPSSLVTA